MATTERYAAEWRGRLEPSAWVGNDSEGEKWVLQEEGSEASRRLLMVLNLSYGPVSVIGLIVSAISVAVYSRAAMRSAPSEYLRVLSGAEFLQHATNLLYFVYMLRYYFADTPNSDQMVRVFPYAHGVHTASSCMIAWLMTALAVDRFASVCRPHQPYSWRGVSQARLIACGMVALSTIAALPSALAYRVAELVDQESKETRWRLELSDLGVQEGFLTVYTWLRMALFSMGPVIAMAYLNWRIVLRMHSIQNAGVRRKRWNTTRGLAVVVVAFTACKAVESVNMALVAADVDVRGANASELLRQAGAWLMAVNAVLNFVLYTSMSSQYRAQLPCLAKRPAVARPVATAQPRPVGAKAPLTDCCSCQAPDASRQQLRAFSEPTTIALQSPAPLRTLVRPLLFRSTATTQSPLVVSVFRTRKVAASFRHRSHYGDADESAFATIASRHRTHSLELPFSHWT